jgi:acyl-coenzyme A thioesterase PaaI-like protein
MTEFEPKDPSFREKVFALAERQAAMKTFGLLVEEVNPGEAELSMPHSKAFTQQNGFMHAGVITAGLDNACGIAAFSLMPAGAVPRRSLRLWSDFSSALEPN